MCDYRSVRSIRRLSNRYMRLTRPGSTWSRLRSQARVPQRAKRGQILQLPQAATAQRTAMAASWQTAARLRHSCRGVRDERPLTIIVSVDASSRASKPPDCRTAVDPKRVLLLLNCVPESSRSAAASFAQELLELHVELGLRLDQPGLALSQPLVVAFDRLLRDAEHARDFGRLRPANTYARAHHVLG